ncbi:MAG: putative glycoside hydrolase, partial [Egibacteraceae bacterium]
PGEYDVASPIDEPYDIVAASLADFVELTEEQRARVIPWLQDFSIGGVTYDAEKVRAQLDATYDTGLEEWILWSPGVRYTDEAIDPMD